MFGEFPKLASRLQSVGARVNARMLVAATGRASGFAGKSSLLTPATAALFTRWTPAVIPSGEIWIEALPDGWCWGAGVPDGMLEAAFRRSRVTGGFAAGWQCSKGAAVRASPSLSKPFIESV